MLGCAAGARERVLAGVIAAILLVTAVDLAGENPIAAAGAAVVALLAVRMSLAGRCGWGSKPVACTASLSAAEDVHVSVAASAAGKEERSWQ